ncbi:hypothetical protein EDB80DRAFT_260638 [Ilyonectria destructans]|nr:hypothetical protein EDB80DRAFT_260638 [Ilyonectria destructans]
MTYARRDAKLLADQNRPYISRDILWLTVNDIVIVKFYRQNDENGGLDILLQWPNRRRAQGLRRNRRTRIDWDPRCCPGPSKLDELASTLVSPLHSAAKATDGPARMGAHSAPWWTEECARAAAGYRAIRRLYTLGFNQDFLASQTRFPPCGSPSRKALLAEPDQQLLRQQLRFQGRPVTGITRAFPTSSTASGRGSLRNPAGRG